MSEKTKEIWLRPILLNGVSVTEARSVIDSLVREFIGRDVFLSYDCEGELFVKERIPESCDCGAKQIVDDGFQKKIDEHKEYKRYLELRNKFEKRKV